MAFRFLGSLLAFSLVVSLGFAQHQGKADHTHHAAASLPQTEAALQIPAALRAEHQELHEQLLEATKVGGETGKAAQKVADKLHAHFVAEEEFALPPLGLLQALAEGKVGAAGSGQAIRLSEQLKREYRKMLAEHVEIKKALAELDAAASKESQPEQKEFVRKLALHAETEETILYPATILVGEYLKMSAHRH